MSQSYYPQDGLARRVLRRKTAQTGEEWKGKPEQPPDRWEKVGSGFVNTSALDNILKSISEEVEAKQLVDKAFPHPEELLQQARGLLIAAIQPLINSLEAMLGPARNADTALRDMRKTLRSIKVKGPKGSYTNWNVDWITGWNPAIITPQKIEQEIGHLQQYITEPKLSEWAKSLADDIVQGASLKQKAQNMEPAAKYNYKGHTVVIEPYAGSFGPYLITVRKNRAIAYTNSARSVAEGRGEANAWIDSQL